MNSREEIRKLARSDNSRLVLYALKRWETECPGDPEPLIDAVKHEDLTVLQRALPLIVRFHPKTCAGQILQFLKSPDYVKRRLAVEHLHPDLGPEAVTMLTALFRSESHSHVLASAVLAVPRMRMDRKLIDPFLLHEDPRVRANTVRAIGLAGGADFRALLEPYLKDTEVRVQNEALKALAGMVSESKLEELVQKRLESPDSARRISMAYFLAGLPLSRKGTLLANLLGDPDPAVAACAARGLAAMNESRAWQALLGAYLDGKMGKLQPLLLRLLKEVPRQELMDGVEKIGLPADLPEETLLAILDLVGQGSEWERWRSYVLTALERKESRLRVRALQIIREDFAFFGNRLEGAISPMLISSVPEERALSAQILWRSGKMDGLELLRKMALSADRQSSDAAVSVLHEERSLFSRQILREVAARRKMEPSIDDGKLPSGREDIRLPSD